MVRCDPCHNNSWCANVAVATFQTKRAIQYCGLVAHGFWARVPSHSGARKRLGKRSAGSVRDQQLDRHRKSVVRLAPVRQRGNWIPRLCSGNCSWVVVGLQSMSEVVSVAPVGEVECRKGFQDVRKTSPQIDTKSPSENDSTVSQREEF